MRGIVRFFIVLALTTSSAFGESPKEAIEAAYKKAELAVSLKFVDGFLAQRAANYEAFNSAGSKMDLTVERDRFLGFFQETLSSKMTTTIESFQQVDPGTADCKIHQVIEVERLDVKTRKPSLYFLDSRATERWVKTARGWRIRSSHLISQTFHR